MHDARRSAAPRRVLAVAACVLGACAATGPAAPPADPYARVDRSCARDADCTVKDVGGCCGYTPECVNRDSPTFAAEVVAECRRTGRAGVCGFPVIQGCVCIDDRCTARRPEVPVR